MSLSCTSSVNSTLVWLTVIKKERERDYDLALLTQLTLQLDWTENRPSVSKKTSANSQSAAFPIPFQWDSRSSRRRLWLSFHLAVFMHISEYRIKTGPRGGNNNNNTHMWTDETKIFLGLTREKYQDVRIAHHQVICCYGNYLVRSHFETSPTSAFSCTHVGLLCRQN